MGYRWAVSNAGHPYGRRCYLSERSNVVKKDPPIWSLHYRAWKLLYEHLEREDEFCSRDWKVSQIIEVMNACIKEAEEQIEKEEQER